MDIDALDLDEFNLLPRPEASGDVYLLPGSDVRLPQKCISAMEHMVDSWCQKAQLCAPRINTKGKIASSWPIGNSHILHQFKTYFVRLVLKQRFTVKVGRTMVSTPPRVIFKVLETICNFRGTLDTGRAGISDSEAKRPGSPIKSVVFWPSEAKAFLKPLWPKLLPNHKEPERAGDNLVEKIWSAWEDMFADDVAPVSTRKRRSDIGKKRPRTEATQEPAPATIPIAPIPAAETIVSLVVPPPSPQAKSTDHEVSQAEVDGTLFLPF